MASFVSNPLKSLQPVIILTAFVRDRYVRRATEELSEPFESQVTQLVKYELTFKSSAD